MGGAAPISRAIDCAIAIIAIVICAAIEEEPFDDAACVGADADAFRTRDSNDAVSPDEGQLQETVAEFQAKRTRKAVEPEFAEPDKR